MTFYYTFFKKNPNKLTKGTRDLNAYLDYSYHLHGCEFEYLFSHPYSLSRGHQNWSTDWEDSVPSFLRCCLIFLRRMSFKTHSNFTNFLHGDMNNPDEFLNSLCLYPKLVPGTFLSDVMICISKHVRIHKGPSLYYVWA